MQDLEQQLISILDHRREEVNMQRVNLKTGYCYFKNPAGKITARYNLPPGIHPIKDGYTFVELSSWDAAEKIVVDDLRTDEQKKEQKILIETGKLARKEAVDSLIAKGELPAGTI